MWAKPILGLVLLVAFTLMGCSGTLGEFGSQGASGIGPTSAPAVAPATSVPAPTSGSAQSASNDPAVAAIQAIIQKADQEQQNAFAKNDPTIMQDTATSDYYKELAQTNNDMLNGGVTAIQLVKIDWGQVTLTSPTTAQASAFETWQTSYSDGSTDEARELNVYTLVQQQGAWKIQSDDHPNSSAGSPDGSSASGPPRSIAPGAPTAAVPPSASAPASGADTSRNWAGYASSSGSFTAVTGTWTVPNSIGQGSFGVDATWVGIGGVNSKDLIQAGTEEMTTTSGAVQWDAWIEMLPKASRPVRLAVKAGDSVTVSIAQQNPGEWLIQFMNSTTGESYQTTVQYTSSYSSAEWIQEAPAAGGRRGVTILPLDNFGTVQFSGGSAVRDGKTVTIAQSGAQPITLASPSGGDLVTPSVLTPDGQGFTVSKAASTATP